MDTWPRKARAALMNQARTCSTQAPATSSEMCCKGRPAPNRTPASPTQYPAAIAAIETELRFLQAARGSVPDPSATRKADPWLLKKLSVLIDELHQTRGTFRQATPSSNRRADTTSSTPPSSHNKGPSARSKQQSTNRKSKPKSIQFEPVNLAPQIYTTKEAAKILCADESSLRRKAASAWGEGERQLQPLPGESGWFVTGQGSARGGRRRGWRLQQLATPAAPKTRIT